MLIFFQPLLKLSENCLLATCITNLRSIHEKSFKLLCPQGQIIDVKIQQISHFELFSAIIELFENWSFVTCMHNKFVEKI